MSACKLLIVVLTHPGWIALILTVVPRLVPPMVDYTVTPFGMTLVRALMLLCAWGNEHRTEIEEITLARSAEPEPRAG